MTTKLRALVLCLFLAGCATTDWTQGEDIALMGGSLMDVGMGTGILPLEIVGGVIWLFGLGAQIEAAPGPPGEDEPPLGQWPTDGVGEGGM